MEHAQDTNWKPRLIFIFLFGFALGILVSSLVFITPLLAVFILFLALMIVLADKVSSLKISREVLVLALALISFSLGSFRYAIKDFHEVKTPLLTGIVVSEPEDKDNSRRFVYRADNGEKVLVSAPLYAKVAYGDRVEVSGTLERPGMIESEDGGRGFDYGAYLAKDDIYHTLSFAQVEVVESGQGNSLKSALLKVKANFVAHTKSILSEPYASLLLGLIVSGRDALPADILEEFRRAGIVHIVVLSGFNITLIAEFLRRAIQRLILVSKFRVAPQTPALISLIGITLFVLMTGAEATVVRASVMAGIVIGAKLFRRNYSASRALIFAGFIMLLENPKILLFDPSFQLSFLATLGLIYFMEPVKNKLSHKIFIKFENLREILSQTLATQLTVLPLLIYSTGDISLVSLPANLLVLLAVPYTMFIGFVSVLISYISVIFAWPLTFITHILLSWILGVAHVLGNLSFATLNTPNISIWIIVLIYLVILGGVTFRPFWKSFLLSRAS